MAERKPNRLIHQKSPYLLQHARNPVDWFAWGEEAFERARLDDKPVLLSIGYSTCHWCHVMERESFENEEIARLMNEHFVSIKVDREERPDIDHIYMTAVSAITGQGGWPLNVFLTPEKQPFYGGTYFPPYNRFGHPGFTEVLTAISHSWKNDRPRILGAGAELTMLLQQNFSKSSAGGILDASTLEAAFEQLKSQFDPVYGGFGNAPKFPMGHTLSFLFRYAKRAGNDEANAMARATLERMANGGLYDQLGGGFHRYSTDTAWHVPHFEKMLYDQALLVRSYLEAFQCTADPFYRRIAVETSDYVLRELRDPQGAFHSAQDADSLEEAGATHSKEGAFYAWRADEIKTILGDRAAEVFFYRFGVQDNGNVQTDPHQEFVGKNILFAAHSLEETAARFGLSGGDIERLIAECNNKLLNVRTQRPRLHLDDKVLVDWNGLMIAALAMASSVLSDDRYRNAARAAADFILQNMMTREGRLLHRYREGEAAILGTLEDYAFFIFALLELYEATFDVSYVHAALKLTDSLLALFWDDEKGGFFLTGRDAEELIVRPKDIYDGALPSGNSVAALVLLRLYQMTSNATYQTRAEALFNAFAGKIAQHPTGYAFCLSAFDFALGPVTDIVLAGGHADDPAFEDLRGVVHRFFCPNKVIVQSTPQSMALMALAKDKFANQPAAFVCQNQSCHAPVNTAARLKALLTGA